MIKKNFIIIGAGWYGCHIAIYLLEKGHKVKIFEKEKDIFLGASGFNQFRLHKGFHYPRSSSTIDEIKRNYKRFISKYKKYIFFPKNNFYCIANKTSLIDGNTYEAILKSNNLKFKIKKKKILKNLESIFLTNEGVIKNNKIKAFYKKKLKKNIIFNKKITNLSKIKKECDYILDCTNNTLINRHYTKFNYVLTLSSIYKKKKSSHTFPLTIMDGKLPSLYPYADYKDHYTLTHADFTHVKRFNNIGKLNNFKKKLSKKKIYKLVNQMEKNIQIYYPHFKDNLTYKGYFLSYKVLPNEMSDKRSIAIKKYENIISCTSPKISNIFSFEDYIEEILKKN